MRVSDLVVDMDARKARYLIVAGPHGGFLGLGRRQHVMVPMGRARVDETEDRVFLDGVDASALTQFPDWGPARFDDERERELFAGSLSPGPDRYAGADYDSARLFGARGSGDPHIVLYEEQVSLDTHQEQVGEAVVRKGVVTEHVHQQVPVMREEVTVERRPISADTPVGEGAFQGEEVRIPLMAEQVTVEKRVVPVEEIVIRKTKVEGTQDVDTEVRRETAEVSTPEKEPV
jgi:uncharacterized protein (TIGR02271 family)